MRLAAALFVLASAAGAAAPAKKKAPAKPQAQTAPRATPAKADEALVVRGVVAGTDVLSGSVSVRGEDRKTRDFAVDAATIVQRLSNGAYAPFGLEALQVGDEVEIQARGTRALVVRAKPAP